jgi:hypothetical protein
MIRSKSIEQFIHKKSLGQVESVLGLVTIIGLYVGGESHETFKKMLG